MKSLLININVCNDINLKIRKSIDKITFYPLFRKFRKRKKQKKRNQNDDVYDTNF